MEARKAFGFRAAFSPQKPAELERVLRLKLGNILLVFYLELGPLCWQWNVRLPSKQSEGRIISTDSKHTVTV